MNASLIDDLSWTLSGCRPDGLDELQAAHNARLAATHPSAAPVEGSEEGGGDEEGSERGALERSLSREGSYAADLRLGASLRMLCINFIGAGLRPSKRGHGA